LHNSSGFFFYKENITFITSLIEIVDMCALRSEDCLSEFDERVPQQANAYIGDFWKLVKKRPVCYGIST
jgi:hypothetical protein